MTKFPEFHHQIKKRFSTWAVVSVDGGDDNPDLSTRGRWRQREGGGGSHIEDPEQREVEAGEFGGEEVSGDRRAVERAPGPLGGETMGMVGVEMGQKVGLALLPPSIDRDQPLLHFLYFLSLLSLSHIHFRTLPEFLKAGEPNILKWGISRCPVFFLVSPKIREKIINLKLRFTKENIWRI